MLATSLRSFMSMVVIWLVAGSASAAVTSTVSAGVLTAASDAADAIAIGCTAPGGNVTVNGSNPGTGAAACAVVSRIVVTGGPGANTLSLEAVSVSAFPVLATTSITGGLGDDVLIGSAIGDSMSGNDGIDQAFMGEGDDVFTWNPGDDSDVLEGQAGTDLLLFNGANVSEVVNLSANGVRTLFTRSVANVTMDLGGVERIDFNALGGADTVAVNSLATTQTTQVRLNLAGTLGGSTGDGQIDAIVVAGSAGDDIITTSGGAQVGVVVSTTTVLVTGAEPSADSLAVNGGSGDDTLVFASTVAGLFASVAADGGADTDTAVARGNIAADTLVAASTGALVSAGASAMLTTASAVENLRIEGLEGGDTLTCGNGVAALFTQIVLDGGVDDDTVSGGNGAEVLIGGPGSDTVDGNQGNDVALLGDGNDTFNWDPGDGSDVVEGQAGTDLLRFNGSGAAENVSISAVGVRARLFRDVANIVMDLDDVEQIEFGALGGADNVVVGDLAQTDVAQVRVLLAGSAGGSTGDGLADRVTVNGSDAADVFAVTGSAAGVLVSRGGVTVGVQTAEPALDRLSIDGAASDDALSATPAAALAVPITWFGGANSGISGAGDLFSLNGETAAENYSVAPNAGGAILARTSAPGFTVTLDGNERLQLGLGNGGDAINTQLLAGMRQILDGGAPATIPGDFLNVANFNGDVLVSPIEVAGFGSITHVNFEQTTNTREFLAFLAGSQQTPPNASTAQGLGTVTLSAAQDSIVVALAYSALQGLNTAVSIQGPAPRGATGPAILGLPASGASNGSFSAGPFAVTPAQATQLKQGLWYFNVASTAPGSANGEIRGQIDNVQFRDGFE